MYVRYVSDLKKEYSLKLLVKNEKKQGTLICLQKAGYAVTIILVKTKN